MENQQFGINPVGLPDLRDRGAAQGVRVGELLFCSGQVGRGNTVAEQARGAFEALRRIVTEAGGTMADIVKITIYTLDRSQLDVLAQLRNEFLEPPFAAATLVPLAELGRPAYLVEIDAIAVVGSGAVDDARKA